MTGQINIRIYVWILFLAPVACGDIFSPVEEADIVNFVENVMTCRKLPGLTLSVVKGDQTWTHGFGIADMKTRRNVTNETLFVIGSLGKAFTMTLLGSLIQNTGYTWNTKLSEIEGLNLEFVNETITREVTLSDLLAHRTGLSTVNDYGFIGGYPTTIDRAFLAKRTKYIPEVLEFRKSFLYNNMMYMLLGHVTEVLSKDSWDNLVTSRIFEPIGMASTKVLLSSEDVQQDDVAKPYIMPRDQLEDGNYDIYRIVPLEPAGGILSNAVDMARWMRFNLRNGTTQAGDQLISEDLFLQAFQDQNMLPFDGAYQSMTTPKYPINDTTKAYGYAWFTSSYRGFKRFWHSGGLFSYISLLWLFPDQQIGIFANVNGPATVRVPGLGLKTILSHVSDILLKQPPWLNHTTACSFPSPWVNSQFKGNTKAKAVDNYTNDKLDEFVGLYGNLLLPDVGISLKEHEDGHKYLWLEMNRIKGELLLTENEDNFKFKMVEPWEYAIEREFMGQFITYPVQFTRSENGVVVSFEITFSAKEILDYRKDVRFVDGILVSSARCHQICTDLMFLLLFILIVV